MKQILLLQIPILFLVLFTKVYLHQVQAHNTIDVECYTNVIAIRKQIIINQISNRRLRRAKVYCDTENKRIPYYHALQKAYQSTGKDIWIRIIKVNPFRNQPKTTQKAT
jgi:uncharacterized protein YifN (PemK superfamily)